MVLARLFVGGVIALSVPLLQTSFGMADAPVLAQAAPTAVPCVVPGQGVHIELQNPAAGAVLQSGTPVIINGIAYDPASTSGPGIASVTVFLGNRDAGGQALGTALLGQPNPSAPANSPQANAGFTLRTPNLPQGNGGRSIFAYAKSSLSGAEGVVEVPIFLNAAPTAVRGGVPTPVLPPPPACTPTPAPTATSAPTATPVVLPPTPTAIPTIALPPTATPVPPASLLPPPPAAAPPAAAPAPAAPAPAPAAATAPATQTTAPRGGGMPPIVSFAIIGLGALVAASGVVVRRRR